MDPRAIDHVLSHPYDYYKPEVTRYRLSLALGEGIFVLMALQCSLIVLFVAGLLLAEGDSRRQQVSLKQTARIWLTTCLTHRGKSW
jgi:hypothetical protein